MCVAFAILLAGGGQDSVTVRAKTLAEGAKGKWSAKLTYPAVTGSALGKFAASTIEAAEGKLYRDFVREAKQFFKKPAFSSAEWSYESDTALRMNGPVLSFKTQAYSYMGGAHGLGVTRTYNFAVVKGKPKRLTIDDVIGGAAAKRELQMRLLEKAMDSPGTDWIQDGEVKSFTKQQLDRFWIRAEGLVFEFDPYELGSYASGPFTFLMTWKDLKGIVNRNGPLRRFL